MMITSLEIFFFILFCCPCLCHSHCHYKFFYHCYCYYHFSCLCHCDCYFHNYSYYHCSLSFLLFFVDKNDYSHKKSATFFLPSLLFKKKLLQQICDETIRAIEIVKGLKLFISSESSVHAECYALKNFILYSCRKKL